MAADLGLGPVDFPTLGFLVSDWIEAHATIPDGFHKGAPFRLSDWQLPVTAHWYRVRPEATVGQLSTAFHFRRAQVVLPQKSGKGPWSAAETLAQALGPSLFNGWAGKDDGFACIDHGCGCGFEFAYERGEPMGMPWPTPLIQVTGFSQDGADNIWRPLQAMAREGACSDRLRVGEEFIRLPNDGRIDVVTSSAQSRLGNPITFAVQDEVGLWTAASGMVKVAETQRRGLAGMGGRAMETTNAWDPSELSVAQRTYEARVSDVLRVFPQAPAAKSFKDKRERRQILRHVYAGAPWVDLDAIEAEAVELMERDPAQAERFFGNRLVAGSDTWLSDKAMAKWDDIAAAQLVPDKATIVLGFDGSQFDDWTAIRGRAWLGDHWHGFTPTFGGGKATWWDPAEHGGEVPRGEVQAAVDELFTRFTVVRMYADPELWQSELDEWSQRFGDKRVIVWSTYRTKQMSDALERLKTDTLEKSYTHDGDPIVRQHFVNARSERRRGGIVIGKPTNHQKIDLAVADALAHEAAGDATAAGQNKNRKGRVVGF